MPSPATGTAKVSRTVFPGASCNRCPPCHALISAIITGSSSAALSSARTATSGPGISVIASACVGSSGTSVTPTSPLTGCPCASTKASGGTSTRTPSRSATPPCFAGNTTGSPSPCSTTTFSNSAPLATSSNTAVDVVCPLADTRITSRVSSASTPTARSTRPATPLGCSTPSNSTSAPSIGSPSPSTTCSVTRAGSRSACSGAPVVPPVSEDSPPAPEVGTAPLVIAPVLGSPVAEEPSGTADSPPHASATSSPPSAASIRNLPLRRWVCISLYPLITTEI